MLLSKNDKIENNVFKEDQKYKGKLQYLTKDYPEFFNEIRNIKFENSEIQSLIYKLNNKYINTQNKKLPILLNKDFLSLGVMGNYAPNFKDYTVNCLFVRYYMNMSTNNSFRIGLKAKINDHLNLKTELKLNTSSDPLNLNFGVDYNFKINRLKSRNNK